MRNASIGKECGVAGDNAGKAIVWTQLLIFMSSLEIFKSSDLQITKIIKLFVFTLKTVFPSSHKLNGKTLILQEW